MPKEKHDARMEDIRVSVGEGEPDEMPAAVDWILRMLSGGNVAAYTQDVLMRAQEQAPERKEASL